MFRLTAELRPTAANTNAAQLAAQPRVVPLAVHIAALMGRAALESWVRRKLIP